MLVAGKQVDPEDIAKAARRWKEGDAKLIDWYPKVVGRAPLELARFVCQRANLWYDSDLRRGYAKALFVGASLAVVVLFIAALLQDLDTLNFILSIVPAAPLLIWAIREGLRQNDAAEANDVLRREVESAIASYLAGEVDANIAKSRARDIQDGIFQRRFGTSPLLLKQLYHWRRSGMEEQMTEGADCLIQRAGF